MARLVWIMIVIWAYAWKQGLVSAHSGGSQRFLAQDDVGGKPNCSDVLYEKMLRGDIPSQQVILFVVVLPIISILGLTGGVVSLVGLFPRNMQVPANRYIMGIATGDIILSISGILHFVARVLDWDMSCRSKTEAYTLKTAAYIAVIGGRTITLFVMLLGLERVLTCWLPSVASRLPTTRYSLAILLAGTAICVLFSSSLFELAVGSITPYHTNATSYILLGPSFGGDRPAGTAGMVAIAIVHHALLFANVPLAIGAMVKVIKKKINDGDDGDQKEMVLAKTYIALACSLLLCMLPGIACSFLSYTDQSFRFRGSRAKSFKTFLFAHYIIEMLVPLFHLPTLVALHVYFRDSLGFILGCVKDEEARRLVTEMEEY